MLSPHVETKLSEIQLQKSARIVLLIGPEGGLSETEVTEARAKAFTSEFGSSGIAYRNRGRSSDYRITVLFWRYF